MIQRILWDKGGYQIYLPSKADLKGDILYNSKLNQEAPWGYMSINVYNYMQMGIEMHRTKYPWSRHHYADYVGVYDPYLEIGATLTEHLKISLIRPCETQLSHAENIMRHNTQEEIRAGRYAFALGRRGKSFTYPWYKKLWRSFNA